MHLRFLGIFIHTTLTRCLLYSGGLTFYVRVYIACSISNKLHNSCSKVGSNGHVAQKRQLRLEGRLKTQWDLLIVRMEIEVKELSF